MTHSISPSQDFALKIQLHQDEVLRRWSELRSARLFSESPAERVIARRHVHALLEDFTGYSGRLSDDSESHSAKDSLIEYGAIRDALFETLEASGVLDIREYRAILAVLEKAFFHTVPQVSAPSLVADLVREREDREKFVLALAHDLRSPITAIRTNAEMIRRQPEKTDRAVGVANRIVATSDRLDRMISNLLDASRIRSGKELTLDFEEIDLVPLVTETIHHLATIHGDRFALVAETSLVGHWNPDGLTRVVENLATNAVKYGAPTAPITIRLERFSNGVEIGVHNYGNPIAERDQNQLFTLFYRSEGAENGTQRGWGIGLVLVKGIAQAHGGIVRVESGPKDGTRFTVGLPWDSNGASRFAGLSEKNLC